MITELAEIIKSEIEANLEDRVAVAFSGGLDSSLISLVASKVCEVHGITVGTENSQDIQYAEKVSKEIGIRHHKEILSKEEVYELYGEVKRTTGLGFLKAEIMVPVLKACRKARELGIDAILFGSGAEELFVGYDRYYRYFDEGFDLDGILRKEFKELRRGDIGSIMKVARSVGIEARFPFYSDRIAEIVFSIPIERRMEEKELKKGLLRDVAKILGLPDIVLKRKKKAAQYGSGVHKILLKMPEEMK